MYIQRSYNTQLWKLDSDVEKREKVRRNPLFFVTIWIIR